MDDHVFSELETAQPGAVIRLPQLVTVNNLNINTYGITLTSSVPATKSLVQHDESRRGLFCIVVSADNVTLSNLKFTGKQSVAIRIDGNNCTLRNLEFEDVKVAFIASGNQVDFKNITVKGFREDGIRIASDGFHGENVRIEDLYAKDKEAHHDGIQFYAGKPGTSFRHEGRYEGRYALNKGFLKNVKIRSTTDPHRSQIGQLQGIFAADGFIDGVQFEDIHIETHDCVHGLSLRGVRDAADGTRSSFKNVSVSITPGMRSDVTPEVRLTSARRITEEGRRAFMSQSQTRSLMETGGAFELQADESNIEAVLFPSAKLRAGDLGSDRSINRHWEAVPVGEMDQEQQRQTIYQSLLNISGAAVFQDFKG